MNAQASNNSLPPELARLDQQLAEALRLNVNPHTSARIARQLFNATVEHLVATPFEDSELVSLDASLHSALAVSPPVDLVDAVHNATAHVLASNATNEVDDSEFETSVRIALHAVPPADLTDRVFSATSYYLTFDPPVIARVTPAWTASWRAAIAAAVFLAATLSLIWLNPTFEITSNPETTPSVAELKQNLDTLLAPPSPVQAIDAEIQAVAASVDEFAIAVDVDPMADPYYDPMIHDLEEDLSLLEAQIDSF